MFRRVVLAVGLVPLFCGVALAGPNAGGTLIVHDPGIVFTSDTSSYPSSPPSCDPLTVDAQIASDFTLEGWVWKVYAAFPAGSAPRLKALVLGSTFDAGVSVLAGGLPSPSDFEISQDGWPTVSGGGVGISFGAVQTAPVVEVYWIGGSGESGTTWRVAPHPTQEMLFVDDSIPPHEDPISGLSSIGFGLDGNTICPSPPVEGACCDPTGACTITIEVSCATGDWRAEVPCDPNPCPQPPPTGACCLADGSCVPIIQSGCDLGTWLEGVPCVPNPCPQPPQGACCDVIGGCDFVSESECASGDWRLDVPCDPNPCPQLPTGACCSATGGCVEVPEYGCGTGDWREGVPCDPNPCPQPPNGACCFPDGTCIFTIQNYCPTGDWRVDVPCDPNLCPQPPHGSCCYPDGTCLFTWAGNCPTGDWRINVPCDPNPCPVSPTGACCFPLGQCTVLTEQACPTDDWREGVPCTPNPCPQPEVGACCAGLACIVMAAEFCDGTWQGAGTDCTPNPCCLAVGAPSPDLSSGSDVLSSAGPGSGRVELGGRTNPCPGSELHQNDDGSFENAFTWGYAGVQSPDYGAFAEGYPSISGDVCGIEVFLTCWGSMDGVGAVDLYVWAYGPNDNPGSVLSVTTCVTVAGVGYWPVITAHDFDCEDAWVGSGGVFVGYWPRSFEWGLEQFGIAMDEDGPGGTPRTNIAPGIGYPTGWQHPSVAGYGLQAFGLRPWVGGDVIPVERTSWGRIKALYHR